MKLYTSTTSPYSRAIMLAAACSLLLPTRGQPRPS